MIENRKPKKIKAEKEKNDNGSSYALSLLDKTNRAIIAQLQVNPWIAQTSLATALSLSQSSINVRLSKLTESGLIKDPIAIDYEKLGLRMARVDAKAKNFREVFDWARKCPLCVNGSSVLNDNNISLYFVTEDLKTLSEIVDGHLRRVDAVTGAVSNMIISWAFVDSLHMRLDLDVERAEEPPCGIAPFCTNCPKNPDYEGKVWSSGSGSLK